MKRRWSVCINPEIEDVEVEADRMWYAQDSGWLTFQNADGSGHYAVFAPGKWVYFKEVTDEPR